MYGKRVTITRTKPDQDPQCIRDFVMGIYHSPAYKDIIAQVVEFPGFCWKKQMIKDTKNDSFFVNVFAFDSEENYQNFMNDPMIISGYLILSDAAKEAGLHLTTEDTSDLSLDI
jgi:hypothetical protein